MTPGEAPEVSPATAAARELLRALGMDGHPAMIAVTVHGPDGAVTVHVSA